MNADRLASTNLALVFTRGVSLDTWDRIGSLSRETALYRSIRGLLGGVTFVTYGGVRDRRYLSALDGIGIASNRWGLPERFYVRLLPRLHRRLWERTTIIKSSQVRGADAGLAIARQFGARFVARCGYLASDFVIQHHGEDSVKSQDALKLETHVFTGADRVVVTTEAMSGTIQDRYGIDPAKIRVIPNFVETDRFRPLPAAARKNVLCFVGRLERQKNLFALLDAIQDMDVDLLIAGNGSLKPALLERSKQIKPNVEFLGSVSHEQLPALLTRASVFVLPSFIEGHPKALLEAMSCGLATVGADVPGIRELIQHRETGYLCGLTPGEIHDAIQQVLTDPGLRARMGRNAREQIINSVSLNRVVNLELNMLDELAR